MIMRSRFSTHLLNKFIDMLCLYFSLLNENDSHGLHCSGTALTIVVKLPTMCKQFFCTTGDFVSWSCCGQFGGCFGHVVDSVVDSGKRHGKSSQLDCGQCGLSNL